MFLSYFRKFGIIWIEIECDRDAYLFLFLRQSFCFFNSNEQLEFLDFSFNVDVVSF